MPTNPAPGELERLRRFVNTWDAEDQTDAIPDPAALTEWLARGGLLRSGEGGAPAPAPRPGGVPGEGLPRGGERVAPADLRRAHAVREALRATLLSHHGEQ